MNRQLFCDGRLQLPGQQPVPWLAAGMCYADLPPSQWSTRLAQMRSAGFTVVDVVVPWRSHAPGRGAANADHDFFGALSLNKFLDEVAQAGLVASLRLGPVASLTRPQFGLPDAILANSAMQARSSHQSPIWAPTPTRVVSVPSYDSIEFLDAAGQWFAVVAREAATHVAVVAVSVDLGDHWFLRTGAFDGDYHADAVAAWHQDHGVEPPLDRQTGDLAAQLAWVRFKSHRAIRAGRALRERLDAAGWGKHACLAVVSAAATMQVRTAVAHMFDGLMLQTDRVHPNTLPCNATPGCVIADVLASRAAWLPPQTSDAGNLAIRAIADGASGLCFTGWVPSDHEVLATTPGRLSAIMAALQKSVWPAPAVAAPVAVVQATHHEELAAVHSGIALASPALARFAGLDPVAMATGNTADAITAQRWHDVLRQALVMAGVAYDVVDDTASADQLASYRVVIAPTGVHLAAHFAATLRDVASRKHTTLVLGPTPAQRDEANLPLPPHALPTRVGRLRAASLDDAAGLAADLRSLGGDASVDLQVDPPTADVRLGRDPARIAVILNDSPQLVQIKASRSDWQDATLRARPSSEFFLESGHWLLLQR